MKYSYRLEEEELSIILDLIEELNSSDYTTIITVEIDVVRLDKRYTAYIETKIDNNFINELDEDILKKYSEMYNEEEYLKKRNDVPVLEFKSTNLKNKIEEKDGFFYYFLLFFIIFWIIVYLFLFCV